MVLHPALPNGFLLLPRRFLRFLRFLRSRPAQRAYLTTLLLSISTLVLFFLAVISYTLFYIHHIPHIGVQKPLHLQFPISSSTPSYSSPHQYHHHPTGIIHFSGEIIPQQEYSVTLLLHLPPSPENQNAGNFMAEITIYSTPPSPSSSSASTPGAVIATGRRGGLMPWRSPIARTAHTLLRLPLLLFLPNTKEEEAVRVVLLEGVVFDELARHAVVSLQSRSRLDVYDARVEFHAKLAGIRWIMWRWRVLSFLLGSGLFFVVEILATGVVWWAVYGWFVGSEKLAVPGGGRDPEGEEETAGEEEVDGVHGTDDLGSATPESLEADDEDDEDDDEVLLKSDVGDSGIGGLSESPGTTAREKSAGGASGSSGSRRRRTRLG